MRICEAMQIYGTSNEILCYGIFPIEKLELSIDTLRAKNNLKKLKFFNFLDDDWPRGIVLSEVVIASHQDILPFVTNSFNRMINVDSCLGAICMYNGPFGKLLDTHQTGSFRGQSLHGCPENLLWTPGAAMGMTLVSRLREKAGRTFDIAEG